MCQLILTLIVGFFDALNFIYVEKNENQDFGDKF